MLIQTSLWAPFGLGSQTWFYAPQSLWQKGTVKNICRGLSTKALR
ncbi:hypothetical protein CEV33_4782 [Brucella grignonensis]|uniref:Uncharacterized protein n=1 Tax=Brucella grignonensis TaxID=94627 RepID=A0A256G313_9HYPH|nr:hypothetical protein CEV33_4782 [Brucella grignonensis]